MAWVFLHILFKIATRDLSSSHQARAERGSKHPCRGFPSGPPRTRRDLPLPLKPCPLRSRSWLLITHLRFPHSSNNPQSRGTLEISACCK